MPAIESDSPPFFSNSLRSADVYKGAGGGGIDTSTLQFYWRCARISRGQEKGKRLCQVANLFVNTLSGEHGVQVKVVSSREYKVDWMRNVNRGLEGNVWL